MTQAGPAIPVIAVTDRSADGGPALRVAVVSDGRPTEGGPARPVIVVTDGRPTQGNEPVPVVLATGVQAGRILAGPAIPVVVVSGSLSSGVAPVNTVLPVISGTLTVGSLLSTTDGTWTGTPAPTFTYQWKRNGVAIGGGVANTYVLVLADNGTTITVTVTAMNAVGSASATSAGAAIPASFLLNEQFTTNASAPLTTPRNAEPGPGVGTIVDTTNKLTIASNGLVLAGGTSTWGDPGINWAQTIFPVGRVFDFSARLRSGVSYQGRVGFRSGAFTFTDASFIQLFQNAFVYSPIILPAVQNTWYQQRIISAAERYYMFIKGGIYTSWQLVFVVKKAEDPNLFPAFTNFDCIGDLDDLQIYDSAGWGELGAYTGYSATGAAITGSADGTAEVTWTPQAAETLDLMIRRTDDTNTLIIRCDQAGSTIKLFSKVAGGEVQLTTAAQTWTANTAYTIAVSLSGTAVKAFVAAITGNVNGYNSKINTTTVVQQIATGFKTTGGAWVKDLLSWPLTFGASFITQTALRTTINVMPYGDSKTADATGFLTDSYAQYLCRAIGTAEAPTRIALGGRSTATAKAAIDADLAAAVGTPDYILYNLGANDVPAMPVQATWQANALYIWDAMHTKWPNAKIYVMKVWVRSQVANNNIYDDTWLPTAVALRSSFVFLHAALDERIFLENGDNGVRYTSDGTHPRIQEGYILTAAQWKIALGL